MAKTQNYDTTRYGTKDAEIQFGHLHTDGVTSAFVIRSGHEDLHYIHLDCDGQREGWTINRCTGVFQVRCGDNVKEKQPAVVIEAINGDIVLSATNGRIRMQAENIDMIAKGPDNKNGNITLDANERIELKSKHVEVNATSVAKFFSSGTLETVGNGLLNIYGGLIDTVDGATQGNRSKTNSTIEERESKFNG
jgi:hypothetical protein